MNLSGLVVTPQTSSATKTHKTTKHARAINGNVLVATIKSFQRHSAAIVLENGYNWQWEIEMRATKNMWKWKNNIAKHKSLAFSSNAFVWHYSRNKCALILRSSVVFLLNFFFSSAIRYLRKILFAYCSLLSTTICSVCVSSYFLLNILFLRFYIVFVYLFSYCTFNSQMVHAFTSASCCDVCLFVGIGSSLNGSQKKKRIWENVWKQDQKIKNSKENCTRKT